MYVFQQVCKHASQETILWEEREDGSLTILKNLTCRKSSQAVRRKVPIVTTMYICCGTCWALPIALGHCSCSNWYWLEDMRSILIVHPYSQPNSVSFLPLLFLCLSAARCPQNTNQLCDHRQYAPQQRRLNYIMLIMIIVCLVTLGREGHF